MTRDTAGTIILKMLYCLSDSHKLDRPHRWHHDQSLYGKHRREKALIIDDIIMIIKAFMESIIVRRRRRRSRYIAGALACTLGENPSAEPVMLRLIIIAKPLFNSIISSAGEN